MRLYAFQVGKFIQLVSTFFGGFVISFVKGWSLALVMLTSIPPIVIVWGSMSIMISRLSARGQAAYADAGIVVEQTIGSLRTVASFTGAKEAIAKYNKALKTANLATVQQGVAVGVGFGAVSLIIFWQLCIGFVDGSKFIVGKGYTGGQVANVTIAGMTGGMSLGQTSPCVSAFSAGRGSAYKMFETINRKPEIDAYDKSGIVLEDLKEILS